MKKLLLFLFLIPLVTTAQITFEADYGHSGTYTKLANSGYKFYVMDVLAQQCRVYNTNHTLWKTIDLDVPVDQYLYDIRYVSENLFTDDNSLSLCYIYYAYDATNQYYTYTAKVINENGTSLLTVEGAQYAYVNMVDDQAKLSLYVYDYSSSPYTITTVIYDLPGELVSSGEFTNNIFQSKPPYPNPATDFAVLPYQLPDGQDQGKVILNDETGKVIHTFDVDRNFNNLQIDTRQLPHGVYFYHLESGNYASEAEKIIVR